MALEINTSALASSLSQWHSTIGNRISFAVTSAAAEMEGYAKQNAPWTDRTGNARRTLDGFVAQADEDNILIGVAGHMPYSPKLELFYGGRYAILMPTVDTYIPVIMSKVVKAALLFGGGNQ